MRHIWSKLLSDYPARLAALVVLAVAAAGCGSRTPVISKPTPSPAASASAKVRSRSAQLTLAEASSSSFTVQYPLVNCNTLAASDQSAWIPLLAGSTFGKCAPVSVLKKDIPQNVPVTDDDPSMSQAQANRYGEALMVMFFWSNWAAYDGAPGVLTTVHQAAGPDAQYYADVAGGQYASGSVPGYAAWPNQITLVSLNSADIVAMSNPSENFALVVSYSGEPYTSHWTVPGQATKTLTGLTRDPGIYTGTIASNAVLGTYLQVDTFGDNCSIGPAAGICQAAGAS